MFAWLKAETDDLRFESQVPLLFCAKSLRARGSESKIRVLLLSGMENLSAEYKAEASGLGLTFTDVEHLYREAKAGFTNLQRFNDYEVHCFLRWIVLKRYLSAEGCSRQVIHFDGDVMFGATLEEIAEDFKGRTFVLQGCPAVTSITDYGWLAEYETELELFCSDIDGYSARAWSQREGYEISAQEKWSGYCWFRPIISSDQDLISYLIHTDALTQDKPWDMVPLFSLYYMQNPMWINYHDGGQLTKPNGLNFTSVGKNCYLDGKKVALWHFQSDFADYVNYALFSCKLSRALRAPNPVTHPSAKILLKIVRRLRPFSRLTLYGEFKEFNPEPAAAQFRLTDILNKHVHWDKSVFSNK